MSSEACNSKASKPDPTLDFIAGTVAGMTSLAVGFPLDTVKVRFQDPSTAGKYSSTFGALTTIVKEERFRGLFKGITTPMAGCAFLNGLVFSSYKFLMHSQLEKDTDTPTLTQIFLAGAGTGIISSVITCPSELIKVRQQAQLSPDGASSTWKVATDILRKRGIAGLYRGLTATALRDIGYGAYFCSYEATCRYLKTRQTSPSVIPDSNHRPVDHSSLVYEVEEEMAELSWPSLLLAGGVAGVMGWALTFQFDVVKTRIQTTDWYPQMKHRDSPGQQLVCQPHPYRTTLSTIQHTYRTGGLRTFFSGLSPTLIRAIPVNMVVFATFELVVLAFR